jgi:hypothetical protein
VGWRWVGVVELGAFQPSFLSLSLISSSLPTSEMQREAWRLGAVESYAFTNQGGCFTLRDVDDK